MKSTMQITGFEKRASRKEYFRLRRLVGAVMKAGADAARKGVPITECPFGVCKGPQDDNHPDTAISSWVLGYMEELTRSEIDNYFRLGTQAADMHGLVIPTPSNPRVKQALIDGYTSEVVQADIAQCETFQ